MQLPDLPSRLITLALGDLRWIEGDDRYLVDMNHWHIAGTKHGSPCIVCLAGAVMARSLRVDPSSSQLPEFFDEDTSGKLQALDSFRRGFVAQGLHLMHIPVPASVPITIPVTPYHIDREAFKERMRHVAELLEGAGL